MLLKFALKEKKPCFKFSWLKCDLVIQEKIQVILFDRMISKLSPDIAGSTNLSLSILNVFVIFAQ